jgi:hypothetical protein
MAPVSTLGVPRVAPSAGDRQNRPDGVADVAEATDSSEAADFPRSFEGR